LWKALLRPVECSGRNPVPETALTATWSAARTPLLSTLRATKKLVGKSVIPFGLVALGALGRTTGPSSTK
jgi:hypothetical protein